ncbi:hypothetical protein [Aestuariicoccus sp. MJ-SS9]|uniref:hypothetical protein n=1 Tax=Aestuariicoccus sp. MJ-SS9 TaxID=3079855 RepID=UPI0029071878|nr:hypothetical protein [Aestuariicoccus sp. MJ-SS9]MDU8911438.1 hypothetical protein [Aestuariicoccus sp. MJ-SS9]
MDALREFLALNGVLVVFLAAAAGFSLYLNLIRDRNPHDWHLLHAGGTARGVLLIGLGGVIHLSGLGVTQAVVAAGLVVVFVWTSTLAMLLRAVTGEDGFHFSGALSNRLAFALYAIGAVCLFPGLALLAWGFLLVW